MASGTTDQSLLYEEEPQLHHHIKSDKDHEPGNTPENMSANNPAPDGGIRAWFVAGGAASIFLCTLGVANSFGTFEQYYLSHQLKGDSASKISWIGSLQSFLQLFAGMLGGPLFDRYGSLVIYPLGVLMGIVMGFLQIPAFAAVSQYFDRKRAAALGPAVSGSSIGGIILPIILSKMLNDSSLGFAWTVRVVGFIILPRQAAPAAFATCPKNPQEVGTYMGMGMAVAGLVALIRPPINGAILDASGGFFPVCMFSGAMAVVGGFVAFAGKSLTSEGLLGWV
ncbi:uncharacterized protein P174DRAFT_424814 [Aspergillus novofumigatus IBT 16806]|uniref:Major facilitator superfamily (MFS) profile domain-containing protein n=1 Tax=Aspergillus novofumigatus (strain IBT 16806) TaxID=1392255 RepID=A0A2I1BW73_ASPN1|nr:uncharacterized protein P174DRAFT_424814 [Aspergillus novofumigatus IBT 16806]PKX89633.1 hypothetical protein P174DRAFT_424814 [Aspergillus novofumigatus IBT 16806]